jgi:MFS family permease
MLGSAILAIVLHCVMHLYALTNVTGSVKIGAVLTSFVLYPTLVSISAALYKYRDDRYKLSKFVVVCLGASQLFLIGGILMFYVLFDSVAATVALGVLYVITVCSLLLLAKWMTNNFWLPRKLRMLVLAVLAAIIILGLVITAGLWLVAGKGTYALMAFSASYAVIFAAVLLTAISLHRKTLSYVYASAAVFPVVTVTPGNEDMQHSNTGAALMLAAAILGYLWGVAAATFLTPPYLGLLVCGLCKGGGILYMASVSRASEQQVQDACDALRMSDEANKFEKVVVTSITAAFKCTLAAQTVGLSE